MGRKRSSKRDAAFELFKESGGRLSSAEIALQLGEKINNINSWRSQDKWRDKVGNVGAPYGNQNAIGNNGGAPKMNQNHYIHGLYSKYFPKATVDIMKDTDGMEPIDILYLNIRMKFAAIIRSQEIMFVKDKDDITEHLKKQKVMSDIKNNGTRNEADYQAFENYREEEWELQFAWDKQATFLKAQSVAMGQLTNMIKRYDEMLHANWDLATEEQKLRVEALKVQLENHDYIKKRDRDKLQLAREKFEHAKDIDGKKYF